MLENILESAANVQLVIGSNDLQELARIIIDKVRDEFVSEEDHKNQNTFITGIAAGKILGKTRSTLWRWEQTGYLIPVRLGKTLKYRLSDVLKVKEGRS